MSISGGSPRAVRHAKQTAALARTATCESGKAKHFTWPSMAIRWCKQVMDIDGHWTSRNEVVFCWGPSCHNKQNLRKSLFCQKLPSNLSKFRKTMQVAIKSIQIGESHKM
jgi:hypothetical protein